MRLLVGINKGQIEKQGEKEQRAREKKVKSKADYISWYETGKRC